MTAPFAADLCGYRESGNPSTSDNNDKGSIEWGHELFGELGVRPHAQEVTSIGGAMERRAVEHLSGLRPDLSFAGSMHATSFAQYAHLRVFKEFSRRYKGPDPNMEDLVDSWLARKGLDRELRAMLRKVKKSLARATSDHAVVESLRESMPEESLLKLDITVSQRSDQEPARLLAGLSSKWSLRTDRAQDCVSQGAKLVNLRRGHMPHFAVLTMEPRPAMLRLIASGSGSVDCVYHLALPELRSAASKMEAKRGRGAWAPRQDLERMVGQGRVRDYDDLVREVEALPGHAPDAPRDAAPQR